MVVDIVINVCVVLDILYHIVMTRLIHVVIIRNTLGGDAVEPL